MRKNKIKQDTNEVTYNRQAKLHVRMATVREIQCETWK